MKRNRLTVTFWIVVLLGFSLFDIFGTPGMMNHHHGFMRWLGVALGAGTFLPIAVLAKRAYDRIQLFLFTKKNL